MVVATLTNFAVFLHGHQLRHLPAPCFMIVLGSRVSPYLLAFQSTFFVACLTLSLPAPAGQPLGPPLLPHQHCHPQRGLLRPPLQRVLLLLDTPRTGAPPAALSSCTQLAWRLLQSPQWPWPSWGPGHSPGALQLPP